MGSVGAHRRSSSRIALPHRPPLRAAPLTATPAATAFAFPTPNGGEVPAHPPPLPVRAWALWRPWAAAHPSVEQTKNEPDDNLVVLKVPEDAVLSSASDEFTNTFVQAEDPATLMNQVGNHTSCRTARSSGRTLRRFGRMPLAHRHRQAADPGGAAFAELETPPWCWSEPSIRRRLRNLRRAPHPRVSSGPRRTSSTASGAYTPRVPMVRLWAIRAGGRRRQRLGDAHHRRRGKPRILAGVAESERSEENRAVAVPSAPP